MKINFNGDFIGIDGNAIKDESRNSLIAKVLGFITLEKETALSPDSQRKMADWAPILSKTGEIDIDNTDYELLHTFIKNHRGIIGIIKNQLLDIMEKAKIESENKKSLH